MRQTRHDLEFMAAMLGLRPSVDTDPRGYVLSDKPSLGQVVFWSMRDPVANTITRRRMAATQLSLPCAIGPQTRHDLEFVADCLGTVEARTVGGFPDMRPRYRYGFIPTALLARAVAEGLVNPAANTRAHNRIADLLWSLPPAWRYTGYGPLIERGARISELWMSEDDFVAAQLAANDFVAALAASDIH